MLITGGPVPITNSETYEFLKRDSIIGIFAKKGDIEEKVIRTVEIMKKENADLREYFDWMVFENSASFGEDSEFFYGGVMMYDYLRTQAELNRKLFH